jgi:hypothetical protein
LARKKGRETIVNFQLKNNFFKLNYDESTEFGKLDEKKK